MKLVKKVSLIVAVVTMFSFILTGCGEKETSSPYRDYSNMTEEEAEQFIEDYIFTDDISDEELDDFIDEYLFGDYE